MTDAKRKRRAKIAADGGQHLQVIADAETVQILNELKKRLHLRAKTGRIIKLALETLLEKVAETTITA